MKRLASVFLLIVTMPLMAANHCVGPSATGSGTGTDWNNLMTLPASPTRGDTYFLIAGWYPAYTMNSVSGTSMIWVKKATVANHGGIATGWLDSYDTNGPAIFYSTGGFNTYYNNASFVDWDGQKGTSLNTNLSGANCYGIVFYMSNYVAAASYSYFNANVFMNSAGITMTSNSFRSCLFLGPGRSYGSGICDYNTLMWSTTGNTANEYLTNCCATDFASMIQNNAGNNSGLLIEQCYFWRGGSGDSANHSEMFALGGSGDITIRYNRLDTMWGGTGNTAYIAQTINGSPTINIYGNVAGSLNPYLNSNEASGDGFYRTTGGGTGTPTVNIYNNTIVGMSCSSLISIGSGAGGTLNVTNNLVEYCQSTFVGVESGGIVNQANNLLNFTVASGSVASGGSSYQVGDAITVSGGSGPGSATFSVTSVSGGVVNGISQTSQGSYIALPSGSGVSTSGGHGSGLTLNLTFNPQYAWVNATNNNFNLVSNTTAGTTLPSPYNIDPSGAVRGGSAAWSIGAYQISGGSCDPCISTQPTNKTVNCASTATFVVGATGNTSLSYQWFKNGNAVSGATQSSYTTPATAGTDNASSWYCAVTDTAGTVNSSTAVLSVELIATQPANQTVNVGQNATFSVTGTSCVTTYQWSRNGTSISGATQSSYTESNCQLSQSGNTYFCTVGTSGESEQSASATLTVNAPSGGTVYYVSPNGNSGNTGLSTNSPWDMATAMSNQANSNTFWFMSGDYTPANCPGNNTITAYWENFVAITKWGPRFRDLASDGTGGVLRNLTGGAGDGTTIDGLQFSNCQYYPMLIRKQGTTNVTIRNCWSHHTGLSWPSVPGGQSGIEVYPGMSVIMERNLFEKNGYQGASSGFNHGIYGAGTNGIYRFNVSRGNGGLGISIDGHSGNPDVNNQIYGNLLYNNLDASDSSTGVQQLSVYNDGFSSGSIYTNYIFGNTIISPGPWAMYCQGSIQYITNNIIIIQDGQVGDGIGQFNSDTSAIWVDYNLRPVSYKFNGPHDVVSTTYGFVNTANGLFWLTSGSAAKGAALSNIHGPTDFFGTTISSVADIGAFQYSINYTNDVRILDPSPGTGADYWAILPPPPTPPSPNPVVGTLNATTMTVGRLHLGGAP